MECNFSKYLQTTYNEVTRKHAITSNNTRKRSQQITADRKSKRGNVYMDFRKLTEEEKIVSDCVKVEVKNSSNSKKETVNERMIKLKAWQEARKKRKEMEKVNIKPIFVTGVLTHKGTTPPLQVSNIKNIKIKKLPVIVGKTKLTMPITPKASKRRVKAKIVKEEKVNVHTERVDSPKRRITRSHKAVINPGILEQRNRNIKKRSPNNVMKTSQVKNVKGVFKFTGKTPQSNKNIEIVVNQTEATEKSLSLPSTPLKIIDELNTSVDYVSPFVTVARGKGRIEREESIRKSKVTYAGKPKEFQREIETNYFITVLDNEVVRLNALCNVWKNYKTEHNEALSDDSHGLIDVTVGKAELLIKGKFEQFRRLVVQCVSGTGYQKVTCEDLQGFWDMVYMQVEDMDIRFNNLNKLKENNWEEEKVQIKRKKMMPKVLEKKCVKSNSILKSMIRAARNKVTHPEQDIQSNGEVVNSSSPNKLVNISTPIKFIPAVTTPRMTPRNQSLLACVLSAEAHKRLTCRALSPMVVMKVASISKNDNSKDFKTPQKLTQELADSNEIYNSPSLSKSAKLVKNKENNVRKSINLISWDTPEAPKRNPSRKSTRLSFAQ